MSFKKDVKNTVPQERCSSAHPSLGTQRVQNDLIEGQSKNKVWYFNKQLTDVRHLMIRPTISDTT